MNVFSKVLNVLTGGVGQKIGDIVDQMVPDKDLARQLKHELDLRILMSEAELAKVRMDAEKEIAVAVEETHQAALNQQDLYTKRTRPKIARQSWLLGATYAAVTVLGTLADPFLEADLSTLVFDPVAFGTLVGPALWYMGMRGFDKWKGNS